MNGNSSTNDDNDNKDRSLTATTTKGKGLQIEEQSDEGNDSSHSGNRNRLLELLPPPKSQAQPQQQQEQNQDATKKAHQGVPRNSGDEAFIAGRRAGTGENEAAEKFSLTTNGEVVASTASSGTPLFGDGLGEGVVTPPVEEGGGEKGASVPYTSVPSFARDMNLVFSNVRRAWPAGAVGSDNRLTKAADSQKVAFDDRWRGLAPLLHSIQV